VGEDEMFHVMFELEDLDRKVEKPNLKKTTNRNKGG